MQKFLTLRQNVLDSYHTLEKISANLKNKNVRSELLKSENLLLEDNFKLVVVGEFSNGKSTFVNALLGQNVLPAKTEPTTTTINRITFGKEKKFILHYRDNVPNKEIIEEDFKNIVAYNIEDDDIIENVGRIAYAEIQYPIEICKNGIELIDTPGTNDLDQVREEITFNFIPQADAVIFILNATQAFTGGDFDFLKERIIKNDISKIFFVLNFKDRLEDIEKDGRKVVDFVHNKLKNIVSNPRIYLLSSFHALKFRLKQNGEFVKGKVPENLQETGFVEFEKDLSNYLLREKSSDKLNKYIKRAVHLGEDLISQNIRVEESTLGVSSEQLKKQIQDFKFHLEQARNKSHRLFERLRSRLNIISQSFTFKYKSGLERVSRQAKMAVNSYQGALNAEDVARAIENSTAPLQQENDANLKNEIAAKLESEMQFVREELYKIFKSETSSNALMVINSSESQGLTVKPQGFQLNYISNDDTSLVGGGLILGGLIVAAHVPFIAIPVAIFGGKNFLRIFEDYQRENFLSKVRQQVNQRYDEIIPQQTDHFQTALEIQFSMIADKLGSEIDGKISEVENQLERLLEEKKRTEINENARRAELKSIENEINTIKGRLLNIKC